MRHSQVFLVSLSIAVLLFLAGDTLTASAHGQSGNCQWHYVQHGETLSGIARMYGTSWQVLAQYNGLHNPNVIRAGSTLCIPSGYQAYPAPMYGYKPHKYYSQPMYSQPTYSQPTYSYPMQKPHKYYPPKYKMPGHGAPMYPAPMYPAPTYPGY